MFAGNNPDALRQMYNTDEAWRVRQETHDRYSVPAMDFASWALSCIEWRGDESILDVGCGPGRWYAPIRNALPDTIYFGVDLHPGMLSHHPIDNTLAVGDAQCLPYADHTFDVIMANHMLYHVQNTEAAISEFRRVLKPEGVFMATTNSVHNMPELQVLLHRAVTLLVPPGTAQFQAPLPPSDLFTLETGTRVLSRHFYALARYDLPSALVFPSAEPVLAYLESTRAVREPQLPKGVYWNDVMVIVREQVNRLVEHFGELTISKLNGVLIATDRGGFIEDYLSFQSRIQEKQ
jgi:SAM-dependent methyltransferase